MTLDSDYLGMRLELNEHDTTLMTYFGHAAAHAFRLQQCLDCELVRYPPATACVWCASTRATWTPIEGRGTVHSYSEVHHAIHPGFAEHLPYLLLLVDLDTQKGQPGPDDALRVVGNLTAPDGALASPDVVSTVGIGSRVEMVFTDVAPGFSLPQWTLAEHGGSECATPWRYPD